MKLFYSPGVCSLFSHIIIREVGLSFELVNVDFKNKGDFLDINPKGLVPALQLDNGEVLTEGVAIVQYIVDQNPECKLLASNGTWERAKALEWLNFIATEVHKSHYPLFHPETGQAAQKIYMDKIQVAYEYIEKYLNRHAYLLGNDFSAVDAYLFTILGWASMVKIDLTKWSKISEFKDKVSARPKVQETLRAEGLIRN